VPFPDEFGPVVLVADDGQRAAQFRVLLAQLRALNLANEAMIEHVGSTAIPGSVAKDVIDVQIRVPVLEPDVVVARFSAAGLRHRPEVWNNLEATRAGRVPKLVFAPAATARRANVHVRTDGSPGARDTLLFRDYLCADEESRRTWDRFKRSLLEQRLDIDLATYGQAKQPAWGLLMAQADRWADATGWRAPPMVPWSSL
jgi:dephospho-CoA kinase